MGKEYQRIDDKDFYLATAKRLNTLGAGDEAFHTSISELELFASVSAHGDEGRGIWPFKKKFPMSIYCSPGLVIARKTSVGYDIQVPTDDDKRKTSISLPVKYWNVRLWTNEKDGSEKYSLRGVMGNVFSSDNIFLSFWEEATNGSTDGE